VSAVQMSDNKTLLFICEKYYLRFYRPLAARLVQSGFTPVWVRLDGPDEWDYDYVDPNPAIEALVEAPDLKCREAVDDLCVFERAVFERPNLFENSYPYTMNVARTPERARRLAEVWYQSTLAFLARFRPRAVFIWNGRYLPYRAVAAACDTVGQLLLISEIGWIPGTIFLDRGVLSSDTTDLLGRSFESTTAADSGRADAFLNDYTARKATMVSQKLVPASEVRHRLLGDHGKFLLLYGCQVDWDTNVVIGARRFRSNEAAVSFLMECMSGLPAARIVVKTHPLDAEKKEDTLREIIGQRGTVVSDIHPHTLIEAADCVSVRNSTLGFEALCYRKPLILLENAKYKHPKLTLEAGNIAEGAGSVSSVLNGSCDLPDREALRKFMLHAIDHYLVPVPYQYFFEPAKLDILSHFGQNQSYQALEHVLSEARPLIRADVDDQVLRAIDRCRLHRPRQHSFLYRNVRKISDWLF
jgi:capsular polysaccharide biosynthesis protein